MGEISKKVKGRIEQAVGGLTGNKALQKEGEDDEHAGRVLGAVKDVKRAVAGAVKDAKHSIREISK